METESGSCHLNEDAIMTSLIPPCLTMHSAGRAAYQDFRDRPAVSLLPLAKPHGHGTRLAPAAHSGPAPPRLSISVEDWDLLLLAVESRLRKAVGERLGALPETPQHSAALSASLVQAIVLDCVAALEQLHAALQTERGQRTDASGSAEQARQKSRL